MENVERKINSAESFERTKLRELESESKWVFHGSGSKIETLEPRQAHNYPKNSEEKNPDDKPAVFASPFADIAIFMSIVNETNVSQGLRSGLSWDSDKGLEFRATKETMDQIHNATGYVYVFDKSKFTPRSFGESLSYEAVSPDDVIMVTEKDLPKNIEIKDF